MPLTLREYASSEAARLIEKTRSTDARICQDAVQAAARRAPGIKAAAEALHQLTIAGSDDIKRSIPVDVKAFVVANAEASSNTNLVERIGTWLKASPWELTRCSSAAAALAAVAPVADVRTQDKKNRNTELEDEVAASMGLKKRLRKNAALGDRPAKRTSP